MVPFRLTIAGKGPELDRLQSRFSKLPEVRIFNGFAPPVDVINSLQESHCVVVPYTSATQSGIAAAALANHRFVIASRIGGLVDVVTNMKNGLLVEAGDVLSLVEAIKLVAADSALRESLMAGAQKSAATDLNWDVIASEIARTFFGSQTADDARG
ncbi:glycosyltransferase [Bradyrhizobium sp. RDM12]